MLLRVDVSGRAGADGQHGRRGASGVASGADGRRGEDAGPAQRGQSGGGIDVVLRDDRGGVATVEGDARSPEGRSKRVSRSFEVGDAGFVDLVARGGRGGDGGRGGRGGNGARGSSGSDATRYSSGGDGGPGGDGGDGGRGGHGANGGGGGTVVVRVVEADTPLLMLVRSGVDGGEGGDPGRHGSGGSGGPGGSGGSSYHWTESETYTDSQGNSQTRTTSHSNPGGSSGRAGRDGSAPRSELRSGGHGPGGSFAIVVMDGAQAGTYPSRFELRVAGLAHQSDNGDGVYEPGEKVHVRDVEVTNVGGMPTPARSEVRVALRSERWIAPHDAELLLPHPLQPGQTHRFEGSLVFTIGDYEPTTAGDALAESERIRFRGYLPAVRREFPTFERQLTDAVRQFVVRFPVEVSPLETLPSLAPGEAARVSYRVTNVSGRAFGKSSELARRIVTRISTEAPDVAYFDEADARVSLSPGFERELATLGPGESAEISGTLAVRVGAEAYSEIRLSAELLLGRIEAPEELRRVQFRETGVRVAERYRRNERAEILLVVNNRTTRGELDAWRAQASRFGTEISTYDVSLECGFDLARLAEDVRGKTIVVLSSLVDTPEGETRAATLVDKDQLHAAWAEGTHVAFVGRRPRLEPLLVTTRAPRAELRGLPEIADYVDGLGLEDEDLGAKAVDEGIDVFSVGVTLWPFQKPRESALARVAARLGKALDLAFPTRRYLVVHHYEPTEPEGSFFARRCSLGRIAVRRTLDATTGALVSLEVDEERLHDASFVASEACTMLLALSASLDTKLGRLSRAKDPDTERACSRALAVDLANEQEAAARQRWSVVSATALSERLAVLATCLGSECREKMLPVLAAVLLLARARVRWWEWLPPFFWLRRAPRLLGAVRRMLGKDAALSEEAQRQRDEWRALKEEHPDHFEYRLSALREPIAGETVETDAELLLDPELRVMDGESFDRVLARDKKRRAKRSRLLAAAERGRGQLLRKESAEELLSAAAGEPAEPRPS